MKISIGKNMLIVCLAAGLLVLTACGGIGDTLSAATPAPDTTVTPSPFIDFSGTDFSGRWRVSDVIDSTDAAVDDEQKEELGAGFTLELLPGGAYFVYDAAGKALGQGEYAVSSARLTLTADDAETVYEIVDCDTLRITEPDSSVTVMKRCPE